MNEYTLKADVREKIPTKQLQQKRATGHLPAVLYGHGVKHNQTLWLNQLAFEKLYKVAGASTLISLQGAGGKAVNVLVHDIDIDPLTHRITHVDFLQVRMDEELTAEVPLEFTGESPTVKEGGTLVRQVEAIEVTCLPKDLPQHIEVDITALATFEDRITIADIQIPSGVKIAVDPEVVVAFVEAPRSQEEMDALNEAIDGDISQVEGLTKEGDEAEGDKKDEKEAAPQEESAEKSE